jgi:heme-degrading monooxygenase HmoA
VEIPAGASIGVTLLRGDRTTILPILREDYEHLVRNPDFIEGQLVESTREPGLYFHVTRWRSEDAFAAARDDPEVHRILGALPDGTLAGSHPSVALLFARAGQLASIDPEVD